MTALAVVSVVVAVAVVAVAWRWWGSARRHLDDLIVKERARSAAAVAVDREATDRFEAALAAITQGVVVVDEGGQTVFENAFAASFLRGRHGQAVVGDTIEQLLGMALDGRHAEREVQLFGPPRRTLLLSARPVTEGKRALGAVVLIDDVTEHERLDAMRRDFVSNISHELRTPIGAMSLLAETLIGEEDPLVIQDLADRLVGEAARMSRTIEDLLELSRIEHGTDQDHGAVSLQAAIREAVDAVRAAAQQRGVAVGLVLPEEDLAVVGDHRQLRSAVFNLVDNAVKYSEPGQGVVSVRAWRRDELIELEVQDNGVGIPRRDLDRVFERFYRVDRARDRSTGGTGLGLSIVRHVAANHGGRITVDSTEGEGSTFRLLLPASPGTDGESLPRSNERAS